MKQNQDYKNEALAALKGRWAPAVLAVLAFVAVMVVFMAPYETKAVQLSNDPTNLQLAADMMNWYPVFILGLIFVSCPLQVGLVNAFKSLQGDGDDRITSNEFKLGFGNYWHHVWGVFLNRFFVTLWSLLLFVPGIIKSLSYAMTNYILVDRPELSANEAINLSKDMMYGHKFDLFYLYLSFAGWFILCLFFTLGIGFLWFLPYVQTAQAAFYADVKADYERRSSGISAPAAPTAPAAAPVTPIQRVSESSDEDFMPKV